MLKKPIYIIYIIIKNIKIINTNDTRKIYIVVHNVCSYYVWHSCESSKGINVQNDHIYDSGVSPLEFFLSFVHHFQ